MAEREATRREDVLDRLSELPGATGRVRFFAMPRVDVSSSLVRRRVAEGRPIRWLVPDAVAAAIAERGLYRSPVGARCDPAVESRELADRIAELPPTSSRST